MFEKFKLFLSESWRRLLLYSSGLLYIWFVWQHEILVKPYMEACWNLPYAYESTAPVSILVSGHFAFYTNIVLPWGFSYDFTLLGGFLAYFLAVVALWQTDVQLRRIKKWMRENVYTFDVYTESG